MNSETGVQPVFYAPCFMRCASLCAAGAAPCSVIAAAFAQGLLLLAHALALGVLAHAGLVALGLQADGVRDELAVGTQRRGPCRGGGRWCGGRRRPHHGGRGRRAGRQGCGRGGGRRGAGTPVGLPLLRLGRLCRGALSRPCRLGGRGGTGRCGGHGGIGRCGRHGGIGRCGRHSGIGRCGRHGGIGRCGRHSGIGRCGRHSGTGRRSGLGHCRGRAGRRAGGPLVLPCGICMRGRWRSRAGGGRRGSGRLVRLRGLGGRVRLRQAGPGRSLLPGQQAPGPRQRCGHDEQGRAAQQGQGQAPNRAHGLGGGQRQNRAAPRRAAAATALLSWAARTGGSRRQGDQLPGTFEAELGRVPVFSAAAWANQ